MRKEPRAQGGSFKKRVLRKYPGALCYDRLKDDPHGEYTSVRWWQVWDRPVANGGGLLGMARSAVGAWKDAARRLK